MSDEIRCQVCGHHGTPEPVMLVSPLAALTLQQSPLWQRLTGAEQEQHGCHGFFSGFPVRMMRNWNDYMPPTVVNDGR